MVAFKPIDLVLTYFFDELRPIAGNVSAQVVIANGAGAIHVPEVVSDVRCRPNATEVSNAIGRPRSPACRN